ncbi:guanine nucleotide binding protein, alpha subunit [Coprinopsis sp. MPI-PUGE-AT-0042]|nr:guanine nucleotide binding protein, alpha subunit [Coprinopsis sp. MPI-PUGE-AT-0042]
MPCFSFPLGQVFRGQTTTPPSGPNPLAWMTAPPPNETRKERHAREASESKQKKVSDEIDEQLRNEKRDERRTRPYKLLLLGVNDSGKTATLKNFRRLMAPEEWQEERIMWRPVIFLNLVQSVNGILGCVKTEVVNHDDHGQGGGSLAVDVQRNFTDIHARLFERLSVLESVQRDLEVLLELQESTGNAPHYSRGPFEEDEGLTEWKGPELATRSTSGWHGVLKRFRPGSENLSVLDGIAETLEAYGEDIRLLWEDKVVRDLLLRRHVPLEKMSQNFLPDAGRIASRHYRPTDGDILKCRLRTLGVEEHRLIPELGTTAREWRLYDMGGLDSQRRTASWAPFFEDADAIIFLWLICCPSVSDYMGKCAQDQYATRLEDSYLLWQSVCSCWSLRQVPLFLCESFPPRCCHLGAKLIAQSSINLTFSERAMQQPFQQKNRCLEKTTVTSL